MSSATDDAPLLKALCQPENQTNAAKVAATLQCRRKSSSPSIEEPLLSSSEQVTRIIQRVLNENTDQELLPEGTSVGGIVKALLISPSIYETPWLVSCQFVRYVQSNQSVQEHSVTMIRSTVANIQSFLQQAISVWWEEERIQTANNVGKRVVRPVEGETLAKLNPRGWLLELLSVAMEPLLEMEDAAADVGTIQDTTPGTLHNNHQYWTLPLELITTTVSLSNDLGAALLHSALDLLFQKRPIRSDRIVPWVSLASELRMYLRDEDWSCVHGALTKILSQKPCPVHRQDLSSLAEIMFSFSTITGSSINGSSCWQELILQLLSVAASYDLTVYSAVETALESNLITLPSRVLLQWTASIINVTSAKELTFKRKCTEANLLLLVLRSSRQSGSKLVSGLMAQAFGKSAGRKSHVSGEDLNSKCWNRLVGLATGSAGTAWLATNQRGEPAGLATTCRTKDRSEDTTKLLRRVFDELSYSGHGSFQGQGDRTTAASTEISSLVYHSLFLEESSSEDLESSRQMHAIKRAKAWVHCANEAIDPKLESSLATDFVVALVIYITVYMEISQTRSSIVGHIIHALSGDAAMGTDTAGVHALFISIVLRSGPIDSSSELDQISDIFTQQLPRPIFTDLALALSPLPSARRALLSATQKLFGNTFQFHRVVQDSYEMLQCGLVALLVLVSSDDWGDSELEAWCVLSDIIVENRPPLPLEARKWLFHEILQLVDNSVNKRLRFNRTQAKHFLRACLARLLHFIGPDENGNDSFLYDNLFVVWSSCDPRQVEDIANLFELTFSLILCLWSEDTNTQTVIAVCRTSLLELVQDEQPLAIIDKDGSPSSMPLHVTDRDFLCYVAFYCLALALQVGSNEKLVFNGKEIPSRPILRTVLLEHERLELNLDAESEQLPTWLSPPKHVVGTLARRHWTSNTKHTIPVRLSLYDMVIDLLLNPKTMSSVSANDLVDQQSSVAKFSRQLGALFKVRRNFLKIMEDETKFKFELYHSSRLLGSFESFCALFVPIAKQYIANFHNIAETDQLLSAIIDFCDAIHAVDAPDSRSNLLQRFLCLWELYREVCAEKAAVRLIAFLERLADDERTNTFCRLPIGTHDDIDAAVRHVRLSVVRSISASSGHFLRLKEGYCEQSESCPGVGKSGRIPLKALVEFIGTLVDDLNDGLRGESGCLTYDLFFALVSCIDDSAKVATVNMPHDVSEIERLSVVATCQRSTEILQRILCSFALTQALTFKKTLMLCVERLPALLHCVNRVCLLENAEPKSEGTNQKEPCVSTTIFDQLASVMKHRSDLGEGANWEEIARDHLGEKDDPDEDDVSVLSDDYGIITQENGRGLPKHVSQQDERKDKLVLQCERTWVWALCCVFQAFENNWEESQRLLKYSPRDFGSKESLVIYLERRTLDLSANLNSLCFALQVTKSMTKLDTTSKPSVSVYAASFPPNVKKRLCSAVDCVLVTLQRSLKAISSSFQNQTGAVNMGGTNYQAHAEALCCISSWLSMQAKGVELTSGIQRWYAVEKKASSDSRSQNGVYTAEGAILRRLPKLIVRLEELIFNARKFHEILLGNTKSGKNDEKPVRLSSIDDLLTNLNLEPTGSGFARLLSAKLEFLEQEQHLVESDFGALPNSQKKRKKPADVAKRVQRERRQRIVRSRNGVIDKFLQLDERVGVDEAHNTDAFADLEDFLVEG